MFYCVECQKENDWPEGIRMSYGRCEMCGHGAPCYDVPTSCLPPSAEQKRLERPCGSCGHPWSRHHFSERMTIKHKVFCSRYSNGGDPCETCTGWKEPDRVSP